MQLNYNYKNDCFKNLVLLFLISASTQTVDMCKSVTLDGNPIEFTTEQLPVRRKKVICVAKYEKLPILNNVYQITVSDFTCNTTDCSWRLMVIVGKCSEVYFCCQTSWKPLQKKLFDVNEPVYLKIFKFKDTGSKLSGRLTVEIAGTMLYNGLNRWNCLSVCSEIHWNLLIK